MRKIAFNGKFLTGKQTGVNRVALELLLATGKLWDKNRGQLTLVVPQSAYIGSDFASFALMRGGRFSGSLWEQLDLPKLARCHFLVNLCNAAPFFTINGAIMIHDAQVYSTPASYSSIFRLWYKLLLPHVARMSKIVITVSDYSKSELVKYGVCDEGKITVIHNGGDHITKAIPDRHLSDKFGLTKGKYVVSLANIQAHKNIQILIRAFEARQLADMQLVLFGSKSKKDFEELGLSVPENVVFVGNISDAELAGLLADACAFACPSLTEGFGLPPLEAMWLGCPVIVTPLGALPEVCGEAAIFASPHAPDEWVQAINRLRYAEGVRLEYAKRVRDQALRFTWQRAAEKLLDCLERVP